MNKKSPVPIKVLLITNIPTPYRIPLFNELNMQFQKRNIRLKVIFSALTYPRRNWKIDMSQCKFEYVILKSKKNISMDAERTIFIYAGLMKLIKMENPEVIITSGFSLATLKVWFLSLYYPINYIIWSGCITGGKDSESFLRKMQRKILISRAAGFIAYGTLAKKYLISLGASPNRIDIAINTVDLDYYKEIHFNNNQDNYKKEIIFVGQFVERKRVDLLFYTVKTLLNKRSDFVLKLVGEGPEYQNLKILANKLEIEDFVSFEGYKQKDQIRKYFSKADCFLFPSEYDIWGLVLVEAMASGLPCVASTGAGAAHDLIRDGVTGFAMDFKEVEKVAEKIDWIFRHPNLSKKIGENAQLFVSEDVSLEKSASGFLNAVEHAIKNI